MTDTTTETIETYAPHTDEPVLISTETVEVEIPPEEIARREAEHAVLDAASAVEAAETMPELMAAMKAETAARLQLMRARGEMPAE